jgi:4-diphosphocytidyl-2-C-methyl-D-erythritol kinase
MRVLAPAKINLWLSVGSRRGDGFHEIASVMQAVSLADEISMEPATRSTLTVEPDGAAPEDETNLVVRALTVFSAATGTSGDLAVVLRKRIPRASGLAGGSADAAATLVGLNELRAAGISRKALEKMGGQIGADVPFCVRGGTALAGGTGTDLSPLACLRQLWWVIASGGETLATPRVYEEFDRTPVANVEDPFELADALARGDLGRIGTGLRNDLYPAAVVLLPELDRVGEALRDAGALGAVMSGSGPAWCGLAADEHQAREIASAVAGAAAWVEVAHSLGHGPRVAV